MPNGSRRRYLAAGCALFLASACAFSARPAAPLRVGIYANYPPFESVAPGGRLTGYDIELVEVWSKSAGMPFRFVNMAWPQVFTALQNGLVDVVVSSVAVSPERLAEFDASVPYYYEQQVLVVPIDSQVTDPRQITPIGILEDSSALRWLVKQGVKTETVKGYDGLPQLRSALDSGKIKAVFGDYHTLHPLAGKRWQLIAKPSFGQDPYAFFVRKGNSALMTKINAGLKDLEQRGELQRLKRKYLLR
ncbi:substrate-binding periplasmic protein [Paludibacterium paludis]|uniref:Amino acid ABC transporter substrate-binding protein n=1 Tax=Paludibacterium paludis TaxID=1225769 RepID=A0A918NYF5_9NEIS|nr:transporter substrate-binding domain-containing protein [Paludibacterium paludis]GGY04231.1 amino acid ABC transporter substrate-binding protein [Paludibacterium paludis]